MNTPKEETDFSITTVLNFPKCTKDQLREQLPSKQLITNHSRLCIAVYVMYMYEFVFINQLL